ncbi:MAG: hypothetical protein FJ333_09460 [Sphingomonadales bacterium]|nr:hypothetical protein [Sphingomonadales bacterium]
MSRKIVPEQVRGFGRYILESVFSALFTRVSIALLRPRIIILGHSGFVEENLQALVASTSDVSTLCFVEKGIGFDFSRHGYYGRVDSYAVWDRFGEADIRNTFNNSLRNEVSVVNLQSFGTLNSGDVSAASKSLMEFEEIEERPRKSRVIILTSAINFGFTPLTASIKDHVDAWGDICSLATDYPNVEFVIRTHPSFDDYSFYRLLCRCEAIGNLTLQSPRSNLSQTAYGSDACLMVTSVTTALEEWASLNKPVGLYAKALHSHKAWRELHTDCQVCIMETKEELISFMAYVEHQERNGSTSPRVAEVARTGISIESLSIQLLDLSDGKVAPNEWGSLISYITFARVIRSTVRVLSTYLVFYSLLSCLLIGSAIAPRFTLRLICRLLFGWRLC